MTPKPPRLTRGYFSCYNNPTKSRYERNWSGKVILNKKRIPNIIAVLLAVVLAVGGFPMPASAGVSDGTAMDNSFEIQYFFGPDAEHFASDDQLAKRIADAGFTIASLQTSYNYINGVPGSWGYKDEDGANALRTAIQALGDNGMKVYLKLGTISKDLVLKGEWNDTSRELVEEYLDGTFNHVIGVDVGDEPSIDFADNYAYTLEKVHGAFPNAQAYFNLFPNWAAEYQLGTGDSKETATKKHYETYLRSFFNQQNVDNGLEVFSIDFYPELVEKEDKQQTEDAYYNNLAQLLTVANEVEGAIPMNIVCLIDTYINPVNKKHIMYQINTNLAFGMKRLSYFTCIDYAVEPGYAAAKEEAALNGTTYGWGSGWLLEKDGTPTETYYLVKEANAQAQHLGSLLYSKQVVSVDKLTGEDGYRNTSFYGHSEYLNAVGQISVTNNSKSGTGLVTLFDDGTFMLTNGSPDKSTTFVMHDSALNHMECFDTDRGTWVPAGKLQQADVDLSPSEDRISLDGGAALVLRVRAGVEKNHVPGAAATCTSAQKCKICSYQFAPAKGHNIVVDEAVEATCTASGFTEGWHCTRCDYKAAQQIVSPKGHTPGEAATCITNQTCTVCSQEVSPAKGHDIVVDEAVAATCTADGLTAGEHCTRCDYKAAQQPVAATGHTAGAPVTTKATAKTGGSIVTKCACGEVLSTEVIEAASKVSLSKVAYTYTGRKVKAPKVVVKDAAGKIIPASQYKVTAPKNVKKMKNIGRYTWIVKFIGDKYKGSQKVSMEIKAKKPTIKAPTATKKAITVKWKKGKKAQVTGYQIMAATNNKFTKNKKTFTVKGYNKGSKKITKLKAKTKYYFKIRTYKTVNGVKIYSDWSGAQTIKTK